MGGRANLRLARKMPQIGEGLRKPDAKRLGVHPPRVNPLDDAKAMFKLLNFADRLLVGAAGIVASVPLMDLHTRFAPEWVLNIPILGPTTVTDGRGNIQRVEARAGYGEAGSVEPINNATSRAWIEVSSSTAEAISIYNSRQGKVLFGFRNELYNVNTINLAQLLRSQSAFSVGQVDPTMTGESIDGYLGWLQTDGADACALLISDKIGGDFAPAVNRSFMAEAARRAGFYPVISWPAPDGQNISLLRHLKPLPNCPDKN